MSKSSFAVMAAAVAVVFAVACEQNPLTEPAEVAVAPATPDGLPPGPSFDPAIQSADRIAICHLEKKVDPNLLFNDGNVITAARVACAAHCRHGDHPMPPPFPNAECARIHIPNGLPECQVNTPNTVGCSVAACIARCDANIGA